MSGQGNIFYTTLTATTFFSKTIFIISCMEYMNTITAVIGNNACTMPDQQGKKVATMTGPTGITLDVIQWTAGEPQSRCWTFETIDLGRALLESYCYFVTW